MVEFFFRIPLSVQLTKGDSVLDSNINYEVGEVSVCLAE